MNDSPLLENLKQELLQAIETQMEREKITQEEVGRRIGSLRNNVNRAFRGKGNASLDFLIRSAESIDLTVEMRIKKMKN